MRIDRSYSIGQREKKTGDAEVETKQKQQRTKRHNILVLEEGGIGITGECIEERDSQIKKKSRQSLLWPYNFSLLVGFSFLYQAEVAIKSFLVFFSSVLGA